MNDARSKRPLAMDVRARRLPNGLDVAIAPMPHLRTATVMVGVRVGSRYETRELNGISHFLEHMLFRGTAAHPSAFEFNLAVEELGGTLNAATCADFTTYELTLPPEHIARGIEILSEIFYAPSLRNLEVEKRIVREEILEGVDEDGNDIDPDDLVHRAVFGVHPLGFKIAGHENSLDRFSETDLRAWHAKHYVASKSVVAVAGAIDPNEIDRVVQSAFANLARGEDESPIAFQQAMAGPRVSFTESPGSQTDVRVALPSVGERHPLRYPTELLFRVLDDGMSTRLFRTVVEDTGLAYETFGGFDSYGDIGLAVVGASIEHAKTPELVRTVLDLLKGLRDQPIEAHELAKAKRRALFELTATLDQADAIAEMLVVDRLFGLELTLEQIAARIETVTLEELTKAAIATIRPDFLQVVTVGNRSDRIERETKRIVQAFR
jgi:predicted Zn-dependent peptidase